MVAKYLDDAGVGLVQEDIQCVAFEYDMESEIEEGGAVQNNIRLFSRLMHNLGW